MAQKEPNDVRVPQCISCLSSLMGFAYIVLYSIATNIYRVTNDFYCDEPLAAFLWVYWALFGASTIVTLGLACAGVTINQFNPTFLAIASPISIGLYTYILILTQQSVECEENFVELFMAIGVVGIIHSSGLLVLAIVFFAGKWCIQSVEEKTQQV